MSAAMAAIFRLSVFVRKMPAAQYMRHGLLFGYRRRLTVDRAWRYQTVSFLRETGFPTSH